VGLARLGGCAQPDQNSIRRPRKDVPSPRAAMAATRFLFEAGPVVIAIVLYEILATGEYDHIGDLGSPKLIIDAGANVGFAGVYFLNRYPDTQIVAIEPDPQSIE
jgi:hypothetical protein